MTVLPWPGRKWELVPCAEPGTTTVSLPCVHRGLQRLGTATASSDGIALEGAAGDRIEIPPDVWLQLAPFLTAAMLKHGGESLPPAERG